MVPCAQRIPLAFTCVVWKTERLAKRSFCDSLRIFVAFAILKCFHNKSFMCHKNIDQLICQVSISVENFLSCIWSALCDTSGVLCATAELGGRILATSSKRSKRYTSGILLHSLRLPSCAK